MVSGGMACEEFAREAWLFGRVMKVCDGSGVWLNECDNGKINRSMWKNHKDNSNPGVVLGGQRILFRPCLDKLKSAYYLCKLALENFQICK